MQNMPNLEEMKVGSVGLSDPGLTLSPISQNEEPINKHAELVQGHPGPTSFAAKRPSPNLDAVADRLKIERELEARQKALLQSFGFLAASQYNPMLNTSSAFSSLPPSLLASNGQLAALASVAAAAACGQAQQPSPSLQVELSTTTEPEDLSMRTNDSRMEPDDSGVDDGQCESVPLAVVNSDNGSDPDGASQSGSGQPSWSYEEQFKQVNQLYELSDDAKRKEWLDDWLSFMHRIGKPVTRIPIMAKQVLDLYELYRLVVSHGGLVEIINKKLWREITKGLNLPSSITSAAFTLRTQYQKYLYDYECDKEGLSSLDELQAAIDGNKREGRRSGAYSTPYSMPPTLLTNKHINGGPLSREEELSVSNGVGLNLSSLPSLQQAALTSAAYREQMAVMEVQRQMERVQSMNMYREAMERQQQQQQVAAAVQHLTHRAQAPPVCGRASTSSIESDASHISAAKRPRLGEEAGNMALDRVFNTMSSTHIKATNRNDGSMVVSMEINGVMYQGLLFAQVPSNNPSG